jgi:hypothetical protein
MVDGVITLVVTITVDNMVDGVIALVATTKSFEGLYELITRNFNN